MSLVVENISYKYDQGEFVVENINCASIQGHNGCGKTTLLKLMAGLLTPKSGSISFENHIVPSKDYKDSMAYIPAESYMFDMLTGIEHAYLCLDLWDIKEKDSYFSNFYMFCEKFKLDIHLHKKLGECSYGTKYKIYLATMLARNPTLILMDEPFTSIDEDSRCFILNYLKSILSNIIIIFSSHQTDLIEEFSTINYFIDDKKIIKIERNM